MREVVLSGRLCNTLREHFRGAVVFKHSDGFTAGVPDISVTHRRTVWIETKYMDPDWRDRMIQRFTMKQLAATSGAIYVVYFSTPKRTMIVFPGDIPNSGPVTAQDLDRFRFPVVPGHDHSWVACWVKQMLCS